MRTMEAIRINKRAIISKCYANNNNNNNNKIIYTFFLLYLPNSRHMTYKVRKSRNPIWLSFCCGTQEVQQMIWSADLHTVKADWSITSVCEWQEVNDRPAVWEQHSRRTGDEQSSVILPHQSPPINNTKPVWLIASMTGKQEPNHRSDGSLRLQCVIKDQHGPLDYR